MKKNTLHNLRYYFIGGFCISSVILLFVSGNKIFQILFILSMGSYLIEPFLSRFSQSKNNYGFSILGSTVRFILIGFILDLGLKTGPTLSVPNIATVVALVGLFLLVVWFSIESFRRSMSATSGTIMLLNLMLIYAILYDVIFFIDPSAFNGTSNFCSYPFLDFIYYSIVTFTTLGYGDIVPVSIIAKLLSASEAFIFTCMIAFVVMNFGKQLNEKKAKVKTEAMPKNVTKD